MCVDEYIAYQCGHRSFAVLRVCPSTTAQHNLPVCANRPTRQFSAETMCSPCERLLHTRWVLIREWEHRWYHERGACGCPVIFPNLVSRPRVIGGPAPAAAAPGVGEALPALPPQPIWLTGPAPPVLSGSAGGVPAPGMGARFVPVPVPGGVVAGEALASSSSAPPAPATRGKGRGRVSRGARRAAATLAAAAGGLGLGAGASALPPVSLAGASSEVISSGSFGPSTSVSGPSGPATLPGAVTVPPVYSETVVGNEKHVAVRLPGLYAAEWIEDHRVLHKAVPNHCPVEARAVPHILDKDEMSVEERALLEDCRLLAGLDHVRLGTGEYLAATASRLGAIFPRKNNLTPAANLVRVENALSAGEAPLRVQHLNHGGRKAVKHKLPLDIADIAKSKLPILGLPIGAGPEGTSHMPNWAGCRLGRPVVKRRRSCEF